MADVHIGLARLLTPPGRGRSRSHLRGGGMRRRSRQADSGPRGFRPGGFPGGGPGGAGVVFVGVATADDGGLYRLDRAAGLRLLPAARAAGRVLGAARAQRGAGHRGGRHHQPAGRPGGLAAARRGEPELRHRPAQLPGHHPGQAREPGLPVRGQRLLPGHLPDLRDRAADLHPAPLHRARPAEPGGRAHRDGQPDHAVLAVPDPALRAQSRAVLAAEGGLDRLSDRGCAGARHSGPAAGAGRLAYQVPPAPHDRHLRPARVGRRFRAAPAVQLVPPGNCSRPGLGAVLRRLGGRRAAPEHDHPDRAERPAPAAKLHLPAGAGHARRAGPARGAVRRVHRQARDRGRDHRGLLGPALCPGAVAPRGGGGGAAPGAGPRAGPPAGWARAGRGGDRRAGGRRGPVRGGVPAPRARLRRRARAAPGRGHLVDPPAV